MTKLEIEAARFLADTCQRANELADAFDPQRTHMKGEHVKALDRTAQAASFGYFLMTGRHAASYQFQDFNTVTPAAWVKAHQVGKYADDPALKDTRATS